MLHGLVGLRCIFGYVAFVCTALFAFAIALGSPSAFLLCAAPMLCVHVGFVCGVKMAVQFAICRERVGKRAREYMRVLYLGQVYDGRIGTGEKHLDVV